MPFFCILQLRFIPIVWAVAYRLLYLLSEVFPPVEKKIWAWAEHEKNAFFHTTTTKAQATSAAMHTNPLLSVKIPQKPNTAEVNTKE